MQEFLFIILAYLIGSIPTAVWISMFFFKIDIRDYGSGNAGATNTFRTLGSSWGSFVMIVDILKGAAATSLFIFIPHYLGQDVELQRTNFQISLGLMAVIGHIFPIWASFKGGKGVATLFGMLLSIQPLIAVCCVGVFLFALYLTRFVSLSSILASIALPIFIIIIFHEQEQLYRIFGIAIALLVILTHQKNIGRILNGMESRVPILKYRDRRKQKRKSRNK